jgi:glycosyltransferase involved in cell wall biosynthesis
MRPSLEGLIFPSKFYGIVAAGRPVIALTGSHGEIADLVRTHAIGAVIEPGDGPGLARTIRSLAADRAECAAMGRRARALLDAKFTKDHAFARWRSLLADTVADSR